MLWGFRRRGLIALWLFLMGLGILLLGVPPSGEEILRGLGFPVTAAYGGVWLALALLFSIVFRAAATAALAALSFWLLFAVFWATIVPLLAALVSPVDPFDPLSQISALNTATGLNWLRHPRVDDLGKRASRGVPVE